MPARHALASPFNASELANWRAQLLLRRRSLGSDIGALQGEAGESEKVSLSSNHLAEAASDAQEQDLSMTASDSDKEMLWQIDRALRKIDTGMPLAFGICEHTREPIAAERLALMPWTPFSAAASEYAEQHGLTPDDLMLED